MATGEGGEGRARRWGALRYDLLDARIDRLRDVKREAGAALCCAVCAVLAAVRLLATPPFALLYGCVSTALHRACPPHASPASASPRRLVSLTRRLASGCLICLPRKTAGVAPQGALNLRGSTRRSSSAPPPAPQWDTACKVEACAHLARPCHAFALRPALDTKEARRPHRHELNHLLPPLRPLIGRRLPAASSIRLLSLSTSVPWRGSSGARLAHGWHCVRCRR